MSPVFDRIGINGYRVLGYDKEEKITIHAETWQGPQSCPYCGAGRLHSKGRYRRRARHLDCLGTSSQLLIHTRRYRCVECGRSFVPSLPELLPWRQSTEPWREKCTVVWPQETFGWKPNPRSRWKRAAAKFQGPFHRPVSIELLDRQRSL